MGRNIVHSNSCAVMDLRRLRNTFSLGECKEVLNIEKVALVSRASFSSFRKSNVFCC